MELEGLVFLFVFFWGRARRERERVGCEDFVVPFFGKG